MEPMKRVTLAIVGAAFLSFGCGGNAPAAPATCDQACQDGVALRALRVGMRAAYNFAIATKPVGMQDATAPCIPTGSVHIVGTAETNAMLGTSHVDLTYTFTDCRNPSPKSTTPDRNYDLTMNGAVNENGMLAMGGPTTSLVFMGTGLTVTGTVYDPALKYDVMDCDLVANQDANNVNGFLCGRKADGFSGF
jgi:hypothetical protein